MSELTAQIWEKVVHGDPDLRSTWHSTPVEVCRACHAEKPTHRKDCPIAQLEQQAEKWELEAKRLYGVGQDIEEMRAALEAKLSKMERQIELAQNAMVRAQPTAHELDGAIVIWETAWNEAEEALAGGEEA